MKTLDPKDYDYLWTDHGVNFIFVSCYLFPSFRKSDIVLIYNPRDKGLRFFLSKKDRMRFARFGLRFYRSPLRFASWKRSIQKNIKTGKVLIRETLHDQKRGVRLLSLQDIEERLRKRVQLFQNLGENYFFTEFFFLDEAERHLLGVDPSTLLHKHLQQMGKIKLLARTVLNSFYEYDCIFKPYVRVLEERLGRSDLQWLAYQDVFRVIHEDHVSQLDCEKSFWLLTKHNKWYVINGASAKRFYSSFHRHFFSTRARIIKGTIANSGWYQGRVKIVRTVFNKNNREESGKVKKGDVLIAETTGPEMMGACQRAGAIVTDEGGLTSHASIISRELGIPCIVGTKIASHVLRDGEVVIVDAKEGRVVRQQKK